MSSGESGTKQGDKRRPSIPKCLVDAHMHIMSAYCTPIPLQAAISLRKGSLAAVVAVGSGVCLATAGIIAALRGHLAVPKVLRFVNVGRKSTQRIAELTASRTRRRIMEADRVTAMPMIAMPMDMEYAHLDGYKGRPIYQRADNPDGEEDRTHFYEERTDDKDGPRKRVWLCDCYWEEYETWETQIEKTRRAAADYPWRLVPMYHYEPRRWGQASYAPFLETIYALKQDGPDMRSVLAARLPASAGETTQVRGGPFIGFKMYPSLGYRASDFSRLPQLHGFYGACQDLDIPILSHCGAGRMYTHDFERYYNHDLRDPIALPTRDMPEISNARRACRTADDYELVASGRHVLKRLRERHWKQRYYDDEYKSPENWKRVLDAFPRLRLCLAHMGSALSPDEEWTADAVSCVKHNAFAPQYREALQLRARLQRLRDPRNHVFGVDDEAMIGGEIRAIEDRLKELGIRPVSGDPAPTEPPLSGWEFSRGLDLRELYSKRFGLADNVVKALLKFTPWNRTLLELISCGRYPNVYLDISYFFLMDARFAAARDGRSAANSELFEAMYESLLEALRNIEPLRRRILFGSDWYMVQMDMPNLREYVSGTKQLLMRLTDDMGDALPQGEADLWTQFAVINPWRFFRFADIRPTYSDYLRSVGRPADVDAADELLADFEKRVGEIDQEGKA